MTPSSRFHLSRWKQQSIESLLYFYLQTFADLSKEIEAIISIKIATIALNGTITIRLNMKQQPLVVKNYTV